MAVIISTQNTYGNSSNNTTISGTYAHPSKDVLLQAVACHNNVNVSSVMTFNGISLGTIYGNAGTTMAISVAAKGFDVSTAVLEAKWTGNSKAAMCGVTLTGANYTSPVANSASTYGHSTAISISLPTTPGNTVFLLVSNEESVVDNGNGSRFIFRDSGGSGTIRFFGFYRDAVSTMTTIGASINTASDWGAVALEISAAASAYPNINIFMMG